MTSDKALGMWYSTRAETNGRRVRPSTYLSKYLHGNVGYEQPSQHNRAQDVQKLFITPGHHRHVNIIQGRFNSIFIGTEIGNTKGQRFSTKQEISFLLLFKNIFFREESLLGTDESRAK